MLWLVCLQLDLMDMLFAFAEAHEEWELDEAILGLLLSGTLGFIYGVRRIFDLRQEVARRHDAEASTSWMALHDPLTRLPNRRFLENFLENAAGHSHGRYTVYALDLDGFKKVNDLIGHHGGNELLAEVASRLTALFPSDLVARIGGDEFVVVTGGGNGDEAGVKAVGDTIIEQISMPLAMAGVEVHVGVSVGAARYPDDARDLVRVMRQADAALYESKRHGRNRISVFVAAMEDELAHRIAAETALRSAVANREITPHYQPLIDLDTGTVRGFEALARWRKPSGETVPPSMFIPLAEETGLIMQLSEQLLRRACQDAAQWPDNVVLSFNISPTQLSDSLLGLHIVTILNDTGLSPQRLEIEITESAIVRELETAARIIEQLHDAGIRVALDDFGTGYSSLSQLSGLKFDKVKIDRSFIASFEGDEKQEKIVRAIIGLGHGLGLAATAEGIEEAGQWQHLRELGCDFGQGYLFGKAMPAQEVARFLSRQAPAAAAG